MAPAADVPEAAVPAADARPLINDESNPPLQVTWHQAGSAPRGGKFDPCGYTPFRSVLNVCHWHTAPPNGRASASAWLTARRDKL